MLQLDAVYPATLELLKKIMTLPELEGFNLAGGTALALQIGHLLFAPTIYILSNSIELKMKLDLIVSYFP